MKAKAEAAGKDASGLNHLQEMIVVCEWVDGIKPTFHFFKDGMYTERYYVELNDLFQNSILMFSHFTSSLSKQLVRGAGTKRFLFGEGNGPDA